MEDVNQSTNVLTVRQPTQDAFSCLSYSDRSHQIRICIRIAYPRPEALSGIHLSSNEQGSDPTERSTSWKRSGSSLLLAALLFALLAWGCCAFLLLVHDEPRVALLLIPLEACEDGVLELIVGLLSGLVSQSHQGGGCWATQ